MNLKIECLEDVSKLKVIEDQGIRINRCSVAKKLQSELYRYLVETKNMQGAESKFRKYSRDKEELNMYFETKKGDK